MAFQFAGTLKIDNPDILITKWRICLIEPAFREEISAMLIESDGATPVDWEITCDYSSAVLVIIEPQIDRVWYEYIQMGMGFTVIADDKDNPFIYEVTDGQNDWDTGGNPVPWPTIPGESVTVGDVTYKCIGQRVQPQIEGPVWGTQIPDA